MKGRPDRRPAGKTTDRKRSSALVLALLSLGCLFLYGLVSWFYRIDPDGDLAIVQLMVRDIVAGTTRPVFFYGQAYMGTLEPYANALTYLAFGRTAWALSLGTVLFTLLAIFHAARLAKRLGGPWCAAAAIAFCTFPPLTFLRYAVSPRGGYGVLFFCTAALLDWGGLLIADARARKTERGKPYAVRLAFLLGLLAGIGFWCNQLVAPAVAAVAVAILLFAPRLLSRPLFWGAGAGGFLLGSAPFWVWNLQNGMASFEMASSLSLDPLDTMRRAGLLLLKRWPVLFDVGKSPVLWQATVLLASVTPVIATILALRRRPDDTPGDSHGDEAPQIWLLLIYLVAFGLCFISSAFAYLNTPRYLLPAIPVLGVLFGLACTRGGRLARAVSVGALVLLVGWGVHGVIALMATRADLEQQHERAGRIVSILRDAGIRTAYAHFGFHSFNIVGNNGEIVFSDPVRERMRRFRLGLERDDSPAVLENYMGTASWARSSGGSIDATRILDLRVATNPAPPMADVEELSSSRWISARDRAGREIAASLTDRNATTPLHLEPDDRYTISLAGTPTLCGIRLYGQAAPFLDGFTIYGRSSTNTPYRPLTPLVQETSLAWSGPRFYDYRDPYPREARFAAEALESIQIRFATNDDSPYGEIFDLQLLVPGPGETSSPRTSLPSLIALLRRQGVRRLYAERWTANQVSGGTRGAIWTNWGDLPVPGIGAPGEILLDRATAVLVDKAGVPSLRETLRTHGFLTREIAIPPFGTLFLPESNQPVDLEEPVPTAIAFLEKYAVAIPDDGWGRRLLDSMEKPLAAEKLEELRRQAPRSVPLLQASLACATDTEAEEPLREALHVLTAPSIGAGFPVCYKGGLTWRGARILVPDVTRRSLVVRSYWEAPLRMRDKTYDLVYTLSTRGEDGTIPLSTHGFPFSTGRFDSTNEAGVASWHVDSYLPLPPGRTRTPLLLSFGLKSKVFPFRFLPPGTDLPTRRNEVILEEALSLPLVPSW